MEEPEERRERDAVANLLKDLARKHNQAEKSKQGLDFSFLSTLIFIIFSGLIILEASYGSIEDNEGVQDLTYDVTIPLQALVRNSQLFIAGGEETKVKKGSCFLYSEP